MGRSSAIRGDVWTVTVDPDDIVTEGDETDNTGARDISVNPRHLSVRGRMNSENPTIAFILERVLPVLLFLVFLALRVYDLDHNPAGLYCDEAAAGYDVQCLLETGMGRFGGEFLPLMFPHFGTGEEGLYRYLSVPWFALFGARPLAIRLTAAIFGMLGLFFMWRLLVRLEGPRVALVGLLLLGTTPWHLHLSRVGFRAIMYPTFLLAAAWLWTRALQGNESSQKSSEEHAPVRPSWWALVPPSLVLSLSLYTYTIARVYTPLFGALLLLSYRRRLAGWRRPLLAGGAMFVLVASPLGYYAVTNPGGFFGRTRSLVIDGESSPLAALWTLLGNWALHLSPDFLFLTGDANPRHQPGGQALYLLPLIPVAVVGLVAALKRRRAFDWLLLGWLLTFPIPAALTQQGLPHALRSVAGLPVLPLFGAIGAGISYRWLKARSRWVALIGGAVWLTSLIASAAHQTAYQLHAYPAESAPAWQYGLREALQVVTPMRSAIMAREGRGGEAPVAVSGHFFEPEVLLLFFGKVSCRQYQERGRAALPYSLLAPTERVDGWLTQTSGPALALAFPRELPDMKPVIRIPSSATPEELGRFAEAAAARVDGTPVVFELLDPGGRPALWIVARGYSQ